MRNFTVYWRSALIFNYSPLPPHPPTPLVTNTAWHFLCLWKLWFVLIGQGSEWSSSLPGSTPWGPTVRIFSKKKKKIPSPNVQSAHRKWFMGLSSCKPGGAGGGKLGTGSGKRQPRRGCSDLNGFCWKKVENRMTKSPVIRVVCLAKWANIEVRWQIRQEK